MDMINSSDTFWKNYLKDDPAIGEKQTIDDPLHVMKDGNTEEEMCLESQPLQADIVFVQSSAVDVAEASDESKLDASDIKVEAVDSFDAAEEEPNEVYELLDVEYGNENDRPCPKKRKRNIIRNTCAICDKGKLILLLIQYFYNIYVLVFVSKYTYERHIGMHERHFNCAHCGMPFKTK